MNTFELVVVLRKSEVWFIIESLDYAEEDYKIKAGTYRDQPGYKKLYNAKIAEFKRIKGRLRRLIPFELFSKAQYMRMKKEAKSHEHI